MAEKMSTTLKVGLVGAVVAFGFSYWFYSPEQQAKGITKDQFLLDINANAPIMSQRLCQNITPLLNQCGTFTIGQCNELFSGSIKSCISEHTENLPEKLSNREADNYMQQIETCGQEQFKKDLLSGSFSSNRSCLNKLIQQSSGGRQR